MSKQLGSLQYAIIILTIITAGFHLYLGVTSLGTFFGPLFILNGLGYLALLAGLYFIPQLAGQHSLIRWLLLGYTAVTFVLYFVFNWPNIWGPVGLIDKTVELILMILLFRDRNTPGQPVA